MEKEPPASLAGDSQVTSKSRRSSRRSSSGAGGRLLQKRLSGGSVNFKTRDAQQPPPKPPRRSTQSLDDKFSLSSLSSTTPSVRDAERVLDEFLRKHGVQLPSSAKPESYAKSQKSKRKSFPQGKWIRRVSARVGKLVSWNGWGGVGTTVEKGILLVVTKLHLLYFVLTREKYSRS